MQFQEQMLHWMIWLGVPAVVIVTVVLAVYFTPQGTDRDVSSTADLPGQVET